MKKYYCKVKGCRNEVRPRIQMCPRHFRMVPTELRSLVLANNTKAIDDAAQIAYDKDPDKDVVNGWGPTIRWVTYEPPMVLTHDDWTGDEYAEPWVWHTAAEMIVYPSGNVMHMKVFSEAPTEEQKLEFERSMLSSQAIIEPEAVEKLNKDNENK